MLFFLPFPIQVHNPIYGGHCTTNNFLANSTNVASVCCQLAVYATSISPKEAVKLCEKTPILLDCHGSLCLPSDLGVAVVVVFSLCPFSLARLCWGSHLWPTPLQVITHLQLIVLNPSHYLRQQLSVSHHWIVVRLFPVYRRF